ncbi:hypothetical protein MKZ38_006472 [Zalerion maritima]|uniref:Uncharacterized protein n=1 Tax=Zalerion maritima TaxID=339359 RepID=A0AAD5WVV1_9PEZI|nr:hypothetical protein MKZ38_006472 [Zalerion maritima]
MSTTPAPETATATAADISLGPTESPSTEPDESSTPDVSREIPVNQTTSSPSVAPPPQVGSAPSAAGGAGDKRSLRASNGNTHLQSTTPIPVPVIPPIQSASSKISNTAPPNAPTPLAPAVSYPPPATSQPPQHFQHPPLSGASQSPPVFGILQPSANSMLQDVRHGHFRDGRIRNPIPSRLKGRTDGKSGKFIVMHMEIENRQEPADRDAAAKRTSEITVMAARKAEADGYRAVRRRIPPMDHMSIPKAPHGQQQQQQRQQQHHHHHHHHHQRGTQPASYPRPKPSRPYVPRAGPLTAEEAKTEQGRLLTLLRNLDPVQVRERLCSAISFFGSSPDGPSPEDDTFPQSAEGNGQGSLFLGWVSEIFPPLDPNAPRPRGGVVVNGVVRRPRGRPRGSKTKNKGITKKSKKNASALEDQPNDSNDPNGNDSWVDIEDAALEVGNDTAEAMATIATASEGMQATTSGGGGREPNLGQQAESQTAQTSSSPATKRRGRPKGSKNRPKADGHAGPGPPQASADPSVTPMDHSQATHQGQSTLHTEQQPNLLLQPSTPSRHGLGRPKGSRNRSKAATTGASADLGNIAGTAVAASMAGITEISAMGVRQTAAQHAPSMDNHTPLPSNTALEASISQATDPVAVGRAAADGPKRKRQSRAGGLTGTNSSLPSGVTPAKKPRRSKDTTAPARTSSVQIIEESGSHELRTPVGTHVEDAQDTVPDPVHVLANATASDNLAPGFGHVQQQQQQSRNDSMRLASSTSRRQHQQVVSPRQIPTSSPSVSQAAPKPQQMASSVTVPSNSPRTNGGGVAYFGNNRNAFSAAPLNSPQFSQARSQQQQQVHGVIQAGSNSETPGRSSPQVGSVAGTSSDETNNSAAVFRANLGKQHNPSALQHNARRGPSTSPLDPAGSFNAGSVVAASRGEPSHHQQNTSFSGHQATSGAPAGVNNFSSFSDPGFLDMSNLDSAAGGLGMTANAYGMGTTSNGTQRASSNSAAYNLWRSSQG